MRKSSLLSLSLQLQLNGEKWGFSGLLIGLLIGKSASLELYMMFAGMV